MRIQPILASLRGIWLPAVLFVWMSTAALAQLPHPTLDWIFPPGGQRGTHVDITVGGADLEEGREFVSSHPKLTARPKRTPADEFYPDGQPIPNQFTVDVGADVSPGFYEAQLVGRHGVSTVRVFHVTDFAEVVDSGKNHAIEQAQPLALGQLVNGRTEAEQEDFYAIELAQGQDVTCEIWARRIDSQAEIQVEVCRADGAPLRSKCRWERRDPVLSFSAPASGKYFLRVEDATFRGGEPFFYRLAVHHQPVVYPVMPTAALPFPACQFTLFATRLEALASSMAASSSDEQRIVQVSMPEKAATNEVLYPIAAEPRELEAERFTLTQRPPTDARRPVRRLSVPSEFVGQFGSGQENDSIELRSDAAGEAVIEVFSQRMGLPTDPFLTISQVVRGPQGEESLKQIAEADRSEERPPTPGYNTTSEDPYVRLKLEKDALYRIMLRDQNSSSRAGQSHAYRLVVRRPEPDFRLLVSPVSPWAADPAIPLRWPLTVRAGDALPIPVVALRQDGFASDIVVTAEGLPPGVHCDPTIIRAGKTAGDLELRTDEQVAEWVGSIRILGESQLSEKRVRKPATPASLVWDTTTAKYDRARLNRQLVIAVIKEPAPISLRFDEAMWETATGGKVKAKLAVSIRAELKEPLNLAPVGLPDGVTAKFTLADDRKSAELELKVSEKTAPGMYDVLVTGKPLVLYQNNPEAAARAGKDQARIAKLIEGFKSKRQQLVAAAGAAADAKSPEIKQLDEQIARGGASLKEASERATKLAAAAKPSGRRSYVVSNAGTLRVTEKAKQ